MSQISGINNSINLSALSLKSGEEAILKHKLDHVKPEDAAKVRELAENFESLFLNKVFESMRKTVPKEGLLSGGNAEEIFRSQLDAEYAGIMAKQRGTGIADAIEKDLLKAMENQASTLKKIEGQRVYQDKSLRETAFREKID